MGGRGGRRDGWTGAGAAAGGAGAPAAALGRRRLLQLRPHRLGEPLEHLVRHVLHQAAAELGQDAGDVDLGDDAHLGLARARAPTRRLVIFMSAPPRPLTSWPEATISAVRVAASSVSKRTVPL